MTDRITYARATHGDEEIEAVLGVLDGGRGTLRIGKNVAAMERRVAALFGKAGAVMCNSGSSALYLAVELLDLPTGAEVITSPLTFSTDLAPIIRAGLVPAVRRRRARHVQRRRRRDRSDDRPADARDPASRTSPATRPTGTGSARSPTGTGCRSSRIRATRSAHAARARRPARAPTSRHQLRLSHIITCAGNGGMVMLDDEALRDRASLRRWGRRSEPHLFGSRKGDRNFWEDLDGIRYDNLFIFDDARRGTSSRRRSARRSGWSS